MGVFVITVDAAAPHPRPFFQLSPNTPQPLLLGRVLPRYANDDGGCCLDSGRGGGGSMEYATNDGDDDDEDLSSRLKFMTVMIIFRSRAEVSNKEREEGEGDADPLLRSNLVLVPLVLLGRLRRWQL